MNEGLLLTPEQGVYLLAALLFIFCSIRLGSDTVQYFGDKKLLQK